jgi:hypothetical protein
VELFLEIILAGRGVAMINPRPFFRLSTTLAFLLAAIPCCLLVNPPTTRAQAMPMAAVPDTPLELVTGSARAVITPEGRDAAMDLLARARQNLTLHAAGVPPFQMKVSFTASGTSQFEGDGTMEEIYAGPVLRWSERLASSSQTHMVSGGQTFATNPTEPVPLRVQMVRGVIFQPIGPAPGTGMIRAQTVERDGQQLTCLLLSNSVPTTPMPRQWVETEFCIDPATALLHSWSAAPGIYVNYDYSDAIQFHGRTLARQITVVEGNSPVLQIHIDSLKDADNLDPVIFQPTREMTGAGPAFALGYPKRFPMRAGLLEDSEKQMIQPVIVHATLSNVDGRVLEVEALQDSDPHLAQEAVELVEHSRFPANGLQQEVFINVHEHVAQ